MDESVKHECGPECLEQAAQWRKDSADNLIRMTPEFRRADIIEAARIAAEMAEHVLPGFSNDDRALALEFTANVLARVMATPVSMLTDTVDTTMVAYSIAAAIIGAEYKLPEADKVDELPAPETPTEELPQIDLRNTGQYL